MTTEVINQNVHKVIDDYIADQNARIGEKSPVPVLRFKHRDYTMANRFVTDDLIRHFGLSVGDTNPLWRDEAYAKASPWGRLIAPPMFMVSVSGGSKGAEPPKVPEWSLMHAGNQYEMERPFLPGDVIDGEDVWGGLKEMTKQDRPYRMFLQSGERHFTDQGGAYVGKVISRSVAMTPKDAEAHKPVETSNADLQRRSYSDEELKEIYDHYDDEIAGKLRRGAEPRFWEDVNEGDDVGQIIKGPVDILEVASFVGIAGVGLGYADKWMLIKEELAHSPRDPETRAYHFNMSWHMSDGAARAMGQPLAINFGHLIEIYYAHAVSNWMGDHAYTRLMDNRSINAMYVGDTLRINGKVIRKYEEAGRGLIEIMMRGVQQDGVLVGQSRAIVQLPHKGHAEEVVQEMLSGVSSR